MRFNRKKRIKKTTIALSGVAKQNKGYGYQTYFEQKCNDYGIEFSYINNHSKVILIKAKKDYYVIETSSNFNENPHIEQFVFTKSKDIYNFYKTNFKKIGVIQ